MRSHGDKIIKLEGRTIVSLSFVAKLTARSDVSTPSGITEAQSQAQVLIDSVTPYHEAQVVRLYPSSNHRP